MVQAGQLMIVIRQLRELIQSSFNQVSRSIDTIVVIGTDKTLFSQPQCALMYRPIGAW